MFLPVYPRNNPIYHSTIFYFFRCFTISCNLSISILLHEVAKLLKYAGVDCVWIRIGTCGGLGVEPGTCIVTTEALNGALEPWHESIVLGERVQRPTRLATELGNELVLTCKDLGLGAKLGKTLCCDDFYEGQARTDGAICDYDEDAKMAFLRRVSNEAGVVNIEMESLQFAAFTGEQRPNITTPTYISPVLIFSPNCIILQHKGAWRYRLRLSQ